jgi:hypothetical protein
MADEPKRKEYNSANWQTVALENARAREAARQRSQLFEALNKFISAQGGWVVSPPGAKHIRVEIPKESSLPVKLADLGYHLRQCGVSTRIANGNFLPVDTIEITLK